MQFGSSSYFFRERSVREALEVTARAGYAFVEVWIEHVWLTGETPEEIRRQALDLGLGLTVHGATHDVNICSTNPGIRRESRQQMQASLELAARLGAPVTTIHPGRLSSSRGDPEEAWGWLMEAVQALDRVAAREGVLIGMEAMENRPLELVVQPEACDRLLAETWQTVGLTVDLAHARTIMSPEAFLDRIPAERIVHVHCSDNSAQHTHLPLGRGTLDVAGALAALRRNYDGRVSLEGYVSKQGEAVVKANAEYLRERGLM